MILTIISFLIFITYLIVCVKRTGHFPNSLSETYYYMGSPDYPDAGWDKTFNRLRASTFTFVLWIMAFLLLPALLELTPENIKFLAFLALAGICFVGAAPEFMDRYEGKIHTISALVAAVFGIMWSFAAGGLWGFAMFLISMVLNIAIPILTKTYSKSKTWWIEMVAFGTVYFTSIILSVL